VAVEHVGLAVFDPDDRGDVLVPVVYGEELKEEAEEHKSRPEADEGLKARAETGVTGG
jgi:hypothetical protein